MEDYAFLKLPKSCAVGNTIFQEHFYDNGDLSKADEKLLKTTVTKMTWLYTLKKETFNIQPYGDEIRAYRKSKLLKSGWKAFKLNDWRNHHARNPLSNGADLPV